MKNKSIVIIVSFCVSSIFPSLTSADNVKLREVRPTRKVHRTIISPVICDVIEVERVKDIQKYIYIKLKSRRQVKGLYGYIYSDKTRSEKIGKFRVISVHGKIAKCTVVELTNIISLNAVVRIELDPSTIIKK